MNTLPNRLPSISIVTPNFNGDRYLQESLRSVTEQGVQNLEHIVVDGLSTDNSNLIIEQFRSRLDHIITEKDSGHANALNKGFARSSGEIMGWLNSDDKLFDGTLRFIQRLFAANPDIEWITGRASSMDEQGEITEVLPAKRWSRLRFLSGDHAWIQQESTFWRRSLWERAGSTLNEDLALANDFELWLRFFRHAQLHTVDRPLGCFRVRPGQRSVVFKEQYTREASALIEAELRDVETPYYNAFKHVLPSRPRTLSASEITMMHSELSLEDTTILDPMSTLKLQLHRSQNHKPSHDDRDSTYPDDIEEFRNLHAGERCFVIGNGPSLNRTDLSRLGNEKVFACNAFFLKFVDLNWRPTYYTCVDSLLLEDRANDIEEMLGSNQEIVSFFPTQLFDHTRQKPPKPTRKIISPGPRRFFFKDREPESQNSPWGAFSVTPNVGLVRPHTVTITMLQLAAYMGFSEIVLLGCDTSYRLPANVAQRESGSEKIVLRSTTDDDPNHFDPTYFGANRKWHMPNLAAIIHQYGEAQTALKSIGVTVTNSTVGGSLDVFDREELDQVLRRNVKQNKVMSKPIRNAHNLPRTTKLNTVARIGRNNRSMIIGGSIMMVLGVVATAVIPSIAAKVATASLLLSGLALTVSGVLAIKTRRIVLSLTQRLDTMSRAQARSEIRNLELTAKLEFDDSQTPNNSET